MKIIDAENVVKNLTALKENHGCEAIYIDVMIDGLLHKEPAIDAEPVRHGHWIKHPAFDDFDICSACGTGCKRRVAKHICYIEYGYPRCPFCGAIMDAADTDVPTRKERASECD